MEYQSYSLQEELQENEKYLAWLCSIPYLSIRQKMQLLQVFGSARQIWNSSQRELWEFGSLYPAEAAWIGQVIAFQKERNPGEVLESLQNQRIGFISWMHPNFPRSLRSLTDCPVGLFYKGKLPQKTTRKIAVVGARRCSRYGREAAGWIAEVIAEAGGEVISGAAAGIDGIAQRAALRTGGYSCGVLGCGIDQIYPSANADLYQLLEEKGGILSEYPPGTHPEKYYFPMRNRIISGLAETVIVVEARKKSGSLITADLALEQGRDVYVVPGRVNDELSYGCNQLLAQGAGIILSPEQIREEIFRDFLPQGEKKWETLGLAPSEKLVYSMLSLHSESLNALLEATALPMDQLCESLLKLELSGLIKETEPKRYVRTGRAG